MKAQLQAINRRRLESRHVPGLDDDEEDGGAGAAPVDEEAEREAWFLQLDLYAIKVGSHDSQLPKITSTSRWKQRSQQRRVNMRRRSARSTSCSWTGTPSR